MSSSLIALVSFFSLKRFLTTLIKVFLITLSSIFVLKRFDFLRVGKKATDLDKGTRDLGKGRDLNK